MLYTFFTSGNSVTNEKILKVTDDCVVLSTCLSGTVNYYQANIILDGVSQILCCKTQHITLPHTLSHYCLVDQ